jgi:hypothetical protein
MKDVLGGAGTYAALGARLVAGSRNMDLVSWIVDKGSDFSEDLVRQIDTWQTSCLYRTDDSRLTTRAWNGYDEKETRGKSSVLLQTQLTLQRSVI